MGRGGDLDSDEAKTRSKRTKEQVQTKNRNKNNTFQSDTPAGRRIGSPPDDPKKSSKNIVHVDNLKRKHVGQIWF